MVPVLYGSCRGMEKVGYAYWYGTVSVRVRYGSVMFGLGTGTVWERYGNVTGT